ncbi:MAG: hypothetical protein ACRD2B_15095 [Terriglobia bacterium]
MRHVPHVVATAYHRQMDSGHTKPLLVSCEDKTGNPAGEFVVKLKSRANNGVTGLA